MQVCVREDPLSSAPLCVSELDPEGRAGGGSGSSHDMKLSVRLAYVGGELLVVALRLRLRWLWLRLRLVRLRLERLRLVPRRQR